MLIVALAWMFVIVLLSLAEATSPQGSVLGAVVTFVFWGLLPLGIVLYLMSRSARRRARHRAGTAAASAAQGHGGGHPPGETVSAERKEP